MNDELTMKTKKSSITISGLSNGANIEALRHYTTDGSVMGLLVKDVAQKKYWTFSYNFNTQVLTKGHDGVNLEYSGDGTDVDLDEHGNIFYTGYAGNGSNTNGVSIYKKGIDGNTSLMGQDNFLKFGTVIKLKSLNGKIYLAVTGKQSNTSRYQLSIVKQD